MSIKINTTTIRDAGVVSNEVLIGAVVLNALQIDGTGAEVTTTAPVRINSIEELEANFKPLVIPPVDPENPTEPTEPELRSIYELASLEYLLQRGANLVVYALEADDDLDSAVPADALAAREALADALKAFDEFEEPSIKLMVVPYATLTNEKAALKEIATYVDGKDMQLFLDAGSVTATAIETLLEDFSNSAKVEVIVNSGVPSGYVSIYTLPQEFNANYHGIYASHAVAARKAALIEAGLPHIPVAGELNGVISEFTRLEHRISNSEKNLIQALNVNVLRTKIGLGALISSQNTLYNDANASENTPFVRSHAVTLTLWIKTRLTRISEYVLQRPNTMKTWDSWSMYMRDVFKQIAATEGIIDYRIVTGRAVMTQDDIDGGVMKAKVYFTPSRPIEEIQIHLFVQETPGIVEASIEGGSL